MNRESLPGTEIALQQSGQSTMSDSRGMREMQRLAYRKRGAQYLLIKSPPASGKSRALMFIALDKLHAQGVGKVLIVVPERSIGNSFADTPLSKFGSDWDLDWEVSPRWNLCNAPGVEVVRNPSTVRAVGEFLESDDRVLVCTHATFRFAFDQLGVEAFDDCLVAIDEFHHVAISEDNKLGQQLDELIVQGKAHVVAMTGSYFRGDAVPILAPDNEAKFETVTYTYFQQLNGYTYLKSLSLRYCFYTDVYLKALSDVLDPDLKTIIHIPNVNARESTKDKIAEANAVMGALGEWQGKDEDTGFHLVKRGDGRILKVADLVDDEKAREQVIASLKRPEANQNRDYVDIIIALGMAKEGFDWVWCEHALTIGYRSSLTEVVQIIGRATRDAKGKSNATFTNLIAEPAADEGVVADAINDTLKAIGASLLMEQVLIPNFDYVPKTRGKGAPSDDFEYGEGGYDPNKTNIGVNEDGSRYQIEIEGLAEPTTADGKAVCDEGIKDLVADFLGNEKIGQRGLFNPSGVPEEQTVLGAMNIVRARHPNLSPEDQEAARQRVIAALNTLNLAAEGNKLREKEGETIEGTTKLLDGLRKYTTDVRNLDVDLIDSINPFQQAYSILSKTMDADLLLQLENVIKKRGANISIEEARDLAVRARDFKNQHGRLPSTTSSDPWERQMAEGVAAFARYKRRELSKGAT